MREIFSVDIKDYTVHAPTNFNWAPLVQRSQTNSFELGLLKWEVISSLLQM